MMGKYSFEKCCKCLPIPFFFSSAIFALTSSRYGFAISVASILVPILASLVDDVCRFSTKYESAVVCFGGIFVGSGSLHTNLLI